ncbi:hypothetical protein [Moorena producens]|uniref:hypothetical protein n=1 Tax=Moorena producens TaxID=1155739 RepID=UPI0013149509|nr:hypothetical protein [Moorena producens]
MPVPLLPPLARCQFHFYHHWQDASSSFTTTGKMPVPPKRISKNFSDILLVTIESFSS